MNRGRIYLLIAAVALFFGWQNLSRTAHETVVLHIPPSARSQDTYVNLWVVEDERRVWLRAESPNRLWLAYLRGAPLVELERADGTYGYRAAPDNADGTREHVDDLFRTKYGVADELRALIRPKTVPIRLELP
jgi:hypothetical protein